MRSIILTYKMWKVNFNKRKKERGNKRMREGIKRGTGNKVVGVIQR